MALEIERKFLVSGDFHPDIQHSTRITQGYLCSAPERTVRVRIKGDKGYISIKGMGSKSGMSRFEWEKEIPVAEVQELLNLCEPGVIDKLRHRIIYGNHVFEVDEFRDENEGLILAEVELKSEMEDFDRPSWLGKEVTGDIRYYNSMLLRHPYSNWEKDTDKESQR